MSDELFRTNELIREPIDEKDNETRLAGASSGYLASSRKKIEEVLGLTLKIGKQFSDGVMPSVDLNSKFDSGKRERYYYIKAMPGPVDINKNDDHFTNGREDVQLEMFNFLSEAVAVVEKVVLGRQSHILLTSDPGKKNLSNAIYHPDARVIEQAHRLIYSGNKLANILIIFGDSEISLPKIDMSIRPIESNKIINLTGAVEGLLGSTCCVMIKTDGVNDIARRVKCFFEQTYLEMFAEVMSKKECKDVLLKVRPVIDKVYIEKPFIQFFIVEDVVTPEGVFSKQGEFDV